MTAGDAARSVNFRMIARLDVKGEHLIKGVHLEGVRKLGDPGSFARRYYREGIDEIIYIDAVASLYGRNSLTEVVRRTAEEVFITSTAGGIMAVTTIDGQPVGNGHVGKLTRDLTEHYWGAHSREGWCDRVEDVIRP